MSSLDYMTQGRLRIEKERAQAKNERYEQLGDRMAALLRGLGPGADRLARDWEQARLWDGCPSGPKGQPGARRKGPQG